MNKVKVGIPGLDEILKGGVKEGSSLLIMGAPGTGKSIMALQFLVEGASKKVPGLLITSEETASSVRHCANSLGIKIEEYEKKGLITILEQSILDGKIVTIKAPMNIIRQKKIGRVALDSLTLFEYVYTKSDNEFRRGIVSFISELKKFNVTLMATSEVNTSDIDVINFRPEDFLFEGLIMLTRIRKGASFERCLNVAKMRGQDHLLDVYPFNIEKGGVNVLVTQLPFSLIEKDVKFRK